VGKSSKPKMQVTEYRMSIHFGICAGPVDVVREILVGEKSAWSGVVTSDETLTIDAEKLFGGIKEEGGVSGHIRVLIGGAAQTLGDFLAGKIERTSETSPAYRGITSLWFTERQGASRKGFYWIANNPYLKTVWATVGRASIGLEDAYARIYRGSRQKRSIFFSIDHSGSMNDSTGSGTRLSVMRDAMIVVLDTIKNEVVNGVKIDVGISAWSTTQTTITRTNASASDIEEIKTWLLARNASGGTSFDVAANAIKSYFTATVGETAIKKRVAIFITDGLPTSPTSGSTGAAILSDILDQSSGSFSTANGTAVDVFGINIDLANATQTALMDNTPADDVPVVDGSDASGLIAAVLTALYGDDIDFDSNPAHIIYECLTNEDWGMGAAEAQIDKDAFEAAAVTLFAENFGLSLMWVQQSTIEAFIREILDHIEATLYVDPSTGKITLRLIRNDYDEGTLDTLTPDDSYVVSFQRKAVGELVNEVVVTWTNPENEREEQITVQDFGGIAAQGTVISDSRNYYGVRTATLAIKLAQRDLRASSSPLAVADVEVNRSAWSLVPGDVIKLQSPEDGISSITMRIANVDYGKPGASVVRVKLVEDVFGQDLVEYDDPAESEWQDPATDPVAMEHVQIITAPYLVAILQADAATITGREYPEVFAAVLANSENVDEYDLYAEVTPVGGSPTWTEITTLGTVPRELTTLALDAEAESETTLGGVEAGGFVFIGTGTDADIELAFVAAFDEETGATTLRRGVLDTVPRAWPVGTPVWFVSDQVFMDQTIRTDGEDVDYRLTPRTGGGTLDLADAPIVSATLGPRPWAPYRPADVQVNGVGFALVDAIGEDVEVTFKTRNRLTEDTIILDWTDTDVTPEAGQTVIIEMYDNDTNALLETYEDVSSPFVVPDADYAEALFIRLKVLAEREGIRSIQGHEIVAMVALPTSPVALTPPTIGKV
jgi:hypothetical protein